MLLRKGGGLAAPNPVFEGAITAEASDSTQGLKTIVGGNNVVLTNVGSAGDLVVAVLTADNDLNGISGGADWTLTPRGNDTDNRYFYYGYINSSNPVTLSGSTYTNVSAVFAIFSGFPRIREVYTDLTGFPPEYDTWTVTGYDPFAVSTENGDRAYLSIAALSSYEGLGQIFFGGVTTIPTNYTLAGTAVHNSANGSSLTSVTYRIFTDGDTGENPSTFAISSSDNNLAASKPTTVMFA